MPSKTWRLFTAPARRPSAKFLRAPRWAGGRPCVCPVWACRFPPPPLRWARPVALAPAAPVSGRQRPIFGCIRMLSVLGAPPCFPPRTGHIRHVAAGMPPARQPRSAARYCSDNGSLAAPQSMEKAVLANPAPLRPSHALAVVCPRPARCSHHGTTQVRPNPSMPEPNLTRRARPGPPECSAATLASGAFAKA